MGSGVVYDDKGDIVTNDHVVGSAKRFSVRLADGQTLPAALVGAYPPDDLAVVHVNAAKRLSPADFGDSASLQVGDIVFAIGKSTSSPHRRHDLLCDMPFRATCDCYVHRSSLWS